MQIKQVGSLRRGAQSGFTLIELIVVIVILGILAATALPKFADLGADARVAKMKGAQGAVAATSAMYHGKWLASGSPSTATTPTTGVSVSTTGYVTAATMAVAAGLEGFTVSDASGVLTVKADDNTTRAACAFTYTESTGVTTSAPVLASC